MVPACRGSWLHRPCQAGWSSPGSGSRSAGSPGGASAALGGQRGLSHSPPKPLPPPPSPPCWGAQTYGAAAPSRRPGAGRRCGSSSRPWCAGRCGISPAGLQGGVSVTVARGRDPGGGGGSQSVLTVADDPSQGLALEVELHVHVLALRDGAGIKARDPAGSGSPAPVPPAPLPATPLPGHSRSGRSCRCGWFWRFRRLRGEDGVMQQWSGGPGEAEPSPGMGAGCEALTLQHGVGLQELLLHLVHLLPFAAHGRHVGHHQLAGLCRRGAVDTRAVLARPAAPPQPRKAPRGAQPLPVLPAPLSPVMRIHWSRSRSRRER